MIRALCLLAALLVGWWLARFCDQLTEAVGG